LRADALYLYATHTGYVIGFKTNEDESSVFLQPAFGFGLSENNVAFVFRQIQFYDSTTPLRLFKTHAGVELQVPAQIVAALEAYLAQPR